MSAGEYGFFLGVAPGVIYTFWNLASIQKTLRKAQDMARDGGEVLDINTSPSIRFNYIFRPEQFVRSQDGDAVRRAKSLLLSVRRRSIRRHALGAVLIVTGGFVGVAIAIGIAPGP